MRCWGMSQMGHQRSSGGIRARSAHPRTTDMQRLLQHVGFVPKPDVLARLFLDRKWRATADEDGHYSLAIPL
jgi:hypothetical protein